MISIFNSNSIFSLSAIQAIKVWADENLINQGDDGIVYMTTNDMWDEYKMLPGTESKNGHDSFPCSASLTLGQMQRISMRNIGPQGFSHSADYATWHLFTPWCEVEVASTLENGGCISSPAEVVSTSVNTAVKLGKSYFYAKYDGVWSLEEKSSFMKAQWQTGSSKRTKCITNSDVVNSSDYKWFEDNGEAAVYNMNSYGNWWHPYPGGVDFDGSGNNYYKRKISGTSTLPDNWKQPDAIAHLFYAKLVLIDPNGPNDMANSAFIIHASGDKYIKYNNQGTTAMDPTNSCYDEDLNVLHCNDWDIGINKYKWVTPDWQLYCALAPNYELLYPNYGRNVQDLIGNDDPDVEMLKVDFDYFFADMPIPTSPM